MKFWHSFLTSMSVQTSEFLNILATLFNIMTEYGLMLASYKNDQKKAPQRYHKCGPPDYIWFSSSS